MSGEGFLQGKRILVTRAKEQASSLSKKIKEHEGYPIEIPLIKFQAPANIEVVEKTLKNLASYDWVVLTSTNGVNYFFSYFEQFNIRLPETNRPQIAVVGKKTYQALENKGIKANLVPEAYVAESLFEEMKAVVRPNDKVLLARGNLARTFLLEQLKDLGIKTDDLVIYETVINKEEQTNLLKLLKNNLIDIITFTSSSTVTYFLDLLNGTDWKEYIKDITFACIGPITENTALKAGIKPQIVATDYTIDGLVTAITKYLNKGES
ncbi:uroporphyrinogen-III synthase [Bacillus sp. Marseille-P3661]|uniref:uroporphyrinogen-III synthase n=1 Tax=Bacillus sp. Marseille-P3661 TaxID=1936234 RepID=UPI000C862243|nr:uroporphyrinogen-III synthase [Bacillus sp. Marseille-P3661]